MRLKNFDKYIKDKLSGYKPAYQEDIWKAIEEKLPVHKVPNGQGSWLIVASAALVIVALVPFLLKFNRVADMRQQSAQNKNEASIIPNNVPATSLAQSSEKPGNEANLNQGVQIAGLSSSIMGIGSTYANHTNRTAFLNFQKNILTNRNFKKQSFGKKVIIAELMGNAIAGAMNTDLNEKTKMADIYLLPSDIDDKYDQDFSLAHGKRDEISRYSDHGGNLKNAQWANWQSIFYPFWKNPAYTGSEGLVNVTTDGRIDAVNNIVTGSVTTIQTNIGVDSRLPILGGLGIGLFYNSTPGFSTSLQTTEGIALSKAIINRGHTCVKIGASFTSINNAYFYNALSFSDQLVPGIGFVNATKEKNLSSSTQAYGINGGIWISNPHLMAGIDVVNINKPHLEHLAEASPLPRQWRGTLGYRFATSQNLQWLPMVIATSQNGINQANAMLTAVIKNKVMLTVAYQNIDPASGLGNLSLYAGLDLNRRVRIFASYGVNEEYQAALGINEYFSHLGIKYQIL